MSTNILNKNNFKRIIKETIYPYKFKYLISSFGGSRTSMLINYLNPKYTTVTNHMYYHLELKHILNPPEHLSSNVKAVYLFSNPMNTVLSIYRRNLQFIHYYNIFGNINEFNAPTLADFINNGTDLYQLENHFDNWTNPSKINTKYPILVINSDFLWDNLNFLFDYLEIPENKRIIFPVKLPRKSNWEHEPPYIKNGLYKIYENLLYKIENYQKVKLIL